MLSFDYKIIDGMGIHARPAGALVKAVKPLDSKVFIKKGEKTVDASKLIAVMGMGIKCGEEITVIVEGGSDEEGSLEVVQKFFQENL